MHMTYLLAIVQCTGPTGLVLYVPEQPPKTRKLDTLEYSTIDPFPIIGFYLYHVISADQSNNWTTSGI